MVSREKKPHGCIISSTTTSSGPEMKAGKRYLWLRLKRYPHISNIPMDAEAVKKFNKPGRSIQDLNEAIRDFFMPVRSFYS